MWHHLPLKNMVFPILHKAFLLSKLSPASLFDLLSLSGNHLEPPHLCNLALNQEAQASSLQGERITMSQSLGILFGETLQFMDRA